MTISTKNARRIREGLKLAETQKMLNDLFGLPSLDVSNHMKKYRHRLTVEAYQHRFARNAARRVP